MSEPLFLDSNTSRFDLPYLFVGQAQKEGFVNAALARIDLLLHPAFLEERADPPAAPVSGATYLVAEAASGAWAGRTGELAGWCANQWLFLTPRSGMVARDLSTGALAFFDGVWKRLESPPVPTGGSTVDSECRAAIVALMSRLEEFGVISS